MARTRIGVYPRDNYRTQGQDFGGRWRGQFTDNDKAGISGLDLEVTVLVNLVIPNNAFALKLKALTIRIL